MRKQTIWLMALAVFVLVTSMKLTFNFFRRSFPKPRKRRYDSLVIPDQKPLSNEINLCHLDHPFCAQGFNCVYQSTPFHIYNSTLTERTTMAPNETLREGYCMPVKRRRCNPYTGKQVLVQRSVHRFDYVCQCLHPHLIRKDHLFGDCEVRVGCSPGYLTPVQLTYDPVREGVCVCPAGYRAESSSTAGPSCRKIERSIDDQTFCSGGIVDPGSKTCHCLQGYLAVGPTAPTSVHSSFRQHLQQTTCLKDPCQWSASNPTQRLPYSFRDKENRCHCDRLHGSFPITSQESILDSQPNACQTFGEFTDVEDISYACTFYRSALDETGRECRFTYRFKEPQRVLGRQGRLVSVQDDSGNWLDSVLGDSYFANSLRSWERLSSTVQPPDIMISGARPYPTDRAQRYAELSARFQRLGTSPELFDCSLQYQQRENEDWAWFIRRFPLCRSQRRVYLSPVYSQVTGQDAFEVGNTRDILQDVVEQQQPLNPSQVDSLAKVTWDMTLKTHGIPFSNVLRTGASAIPLETRLEPHLIIRTAATGSAHRKYPQSFFT